MSASEARPAPSPRSRNLPRGMLTVSAVAALSAFVWGCESRLPDDHAQSASEPVEVDEITLTARPDNSPPQQITKSDEEWRAQLTAQQYAVTRQKATERAFTGEYWDNKEPGKYKCVCCGAELFTSETKYDSGCGWPSFFAAAKPANLHTETDLTLGMVRTEVTCQHCGAHLGHLFDDGPQPTGQRYCMNSAALKFEKKENE